MVENAKPLPGSDGPIDESERVELVDMLRGFALSGVLFSNVYLWFSGRILLEPAKLTSIMQNPVNVALEVFERYVTGGKFVTIFSFLFGIGLAVQFERARKRNQSAARFYLRRGSGMLLLALVHVSLWYGDILHIYALAGLFVLPFVDRKPKTILFWGLALSVLGPTSASVISAIIVPALSTPEAIATQSTNHAIRLAENHAHILQTFAHGSFGAVIEANFEAYWVQFINIGAIGFFFEVLGKILCGYGAYTWGLFRNVETHRRLWQRLLVVGLLVGIGVEFFRHTLPLVIDLPKTGLVAQIWTVMRRMLGSVHTLSLGSAHVALLSLASLRKWWQPKLAVLAPAGRMALTNYLMQTVLAMFVFYGIGLGAIGRIDGLTIFWLPVGIFVFQVASSHIWLRFFLYGPIEWCWRSYTYGCWQPMRRGATSNQGS